MRIGLILALALTSGCLAYVHSPSGRSFPLESSKTLYKRETGMQVEAGGGLEAGVGLPGFNVRVRHGIVDKLDGSAEFGYQRIRTEEFYLATSDRKRFHGAAGNQVRDNRPRRADRRSGGRRLGGRLVSRPRSVDDLRL